MKLKTIKAHYYEAKLRNPGTIYMADKDHGGAVVRSGACKEVKVAPKKKEPKAKK